MDDSIWIWKNPIQKNELFHTSDNNSIFTFEIEILQITEYTIRAHIEHLQTDTSLYFPTKFQEKLLSGFVGCTRRAYFINPLVFWIFIQNQFFNKATKAVQRIAIWQLRTYTNMQLQKIFLPISKLTKTRTYNTAEKLNTTRRLPVFVDINN